MYRSEVVSIPQRVICHDELKDSRRIDLGEEIASVLPARGNARMEITLWRIQSTIITRLRPMFSAILCDHIHIPSRLSKFNQHNHNSSGTHFCLSCHRLRG